MFVRVWEYDVVPERAEEFERAYRGDGAWAELFARAEGFVGTELFRSVEAPGRYLTVDRFDSETSWQTFLRDNVADYRGLDESCSGLTLDARALV